MSKNKHKNFVDNSVDFPPWLAESRQLDDMASRASDIEPWITTPVLHELGVMSGIDRPKPATADVIGRVAAQVGAPVLYTIQKMSGEHGRVRDQYVKRPAQLRALRQFDSTLGFPGEGPGTGPAGVFVPNPSGGGIIPETGTQHIWSDTDPRRTRGSPLDNGGQSLDPSTLSDDNRFHYVDPTVRGPQPVLIDEASQFYPSTTPAPRSSASSSTAAPIERKRMSLMPVAPPSKGKKGGGMLPGTVNPRIPVAPIVGIPKQKNIPSAVTSRDGINNIYMSGNQQKKKKKNNKGRKQKKRTMKAKNLKLNDMFRQASGRGKKGPRQTTFGRKEYKAPLITAPTAASTLNRGNRVTFKPGKMGGMRINTRIFLGKLVYSSTGTTIWAPAGGGADTAGQWYCNVASVSYMGNSAVPKIAGYFDEYIMHDCAMVYSSSTLPSANYKVTWCFCNTPDHWERLGVATGVTTPLKTEILAMPNSWDFNAWLPETTIRMPKGGNCGKRLSTATPEGVNGLVNFGLNSAAERQSYVGTMGVRVDGTIPAANIDVGDMFIELDFELIGMSGLYAAAVSLNLQHQREKKLADRSEFDRFKKFLEEEKSSLSKGVALEMELKRNLLIKEHKNLARNHNLVPMEIETRKKKSSSTKSTSSRMTIDSDSEEYQNPDVTRKFDSTLGFPGEGPFTCDKKKLHAWCGEVLLSNMSYYRERKTRHAELNSLVSEGGTYVIPTTTFSSLVLGLTTRQDALDSNGILALNTLVSALYDKTDVLTVIEAEDLEGKDKEK